jgi:hypothetical protein
MSAVSDPERLTGKPEKNGGDDGTRTRGLCRDSSPREVISDEQE